MLSTVITPLNTDIKKDLSRERQACLIIYIFEYNA